MKKNIPISKISYLYKGWKPTDENVTHILQKPIYSYIESSYNSIVMMNVHNDDNSYEFNYLVFIDENSKSFVINNEPTKVYSGKSVSSPTDTTIKWSENQGMLLDITPQDILDESYSTTITWTLSDAP